MTNTTDLGKLILRVGFGAMMLTHGIPKLMKLLSGDTQFADPFGLGGTATLLLAVLAEFICPILIMIGYKTKLASILPIITMLVAAFIIHGDDPWSKKEFALIYGLGFLAIGLIGNGKFAIEKD